MVQAIIQGHQCYPQLMEPRESGLAPKSSTAFGGFVFYACLALANAAGVHWNIFDNSRKFTKKLGDGFC